MIGLPLAVCPDVAVPDDGVKEPHAEPALQVTLQLTPAFEGSFDTVADTWAEVPTWRLDGGGAVKAIVIGVPTVTRAVTCLVSSATAVAVIVTTMFALGAV